MSGKVEYTDVEILRAIREGRESQVLNALYEQLLPTVRNYVCSNSGDEEEAYDVFQDALALFYRLVITDKFNEKYKVAGFIYTVSRNYWINRAKKLKKQTSFEDVREHDQVDEGVLDQMMSKEKRNAVMELFNSIGEKCSQLLMCSVIRKMTMDEICEELGYPNANAAKTQNYRCKKQMMEAAKQNKYYADVLLA